ncbi:hypothetical protein BROUX41_006160 [Berkeleyomyces rouxiae]
MKSILLAASTLALIAAQGVESKPASTTDIALISSATMPISSQMTLPPNLKNIPWYVDKVNYPMELLDGVKNMKDLAKLPPVAIYIYGESTSAEAVFVFRDYFTTKFENGQTLLGAAHAEPTRTVPAANPAEITTPPTQDKVPHYMLPYNMDLVRNAKSPDDFKKLPDVVFVIGTETMKVPADIHFSDLYNAIMATYFPANPPNTKVNPKTTATWPLDLSENPTETLNPVVPDTPNAPEITSPPTVNGLPYIFPYGKDFLTNPKLVDSLPDITLDNGGLFTVVPARVYYADLLTTLHKVVRPATDRLKDKQN